MVRTVVSATDLRVRLGEMLRRLEHEDLVIEKGGVPVAVLTRYMPEPASRSPVAGGKHDEYEAALVKRADARGWETTLDAIRSGWGSEVDADAMARRVYEARDMNRRRSRNYTVDLENESAPGSEDGDHAWTTPLLDSDVCIDLLRTRSVWPMQELRRMTLGPPAITLITYGEVLEGVLFSREPVRAHLT